MSCNAPQVTLWDVAAGARSDRSRPRLPRAVAFAPDGRLLAIGLNSGEILLWDRPRTSRSPVRGHPKGVTDLNFAPDGRSLASAGVDGTVRIWDMPAP